MKEEWKTIDNFPNYQISNLGNVKSMERFVNSIHNSKRIVKEKKLKQTSNKLGYKFVTLYNKNGKSIPYQIHRLVAKAFLENPNNYVIVNHKDANPSNNNVENLEWCTQSHNIKEAYRLGNAKPQLTGMGKLGKKNKRAKKIKQIDIKTNKIINYYYGTLEAERKTGINFRNIHMCLKKKRKSAGGYKWEYF